MSIERGVSSTGISRPTETSKKGKTEIDKGAGVDSATREHQSVTFDEISFVAGILGYVTGEGITGKKLWGLVCGAVAVYAALDRGGEKEISVVIKSSEAGKGPVKIPINTVNPEYENKQPFGFIDETAKGLQ